MSSQRQHPITEQVSAIVAQAFSKAHKDSTYAELAGEEKAPIWLNLEDDLKALLRFVAESRAQASQARRHVHTYNSNDYCDICGQDGRA